MKISVKAHPKSRQNKVEKRDEKNFEVWVHAAPDRGQANRAVLEALSGYLKIPRARMEIVAGLTAKNKIIQIT